MPNQNKIIVKNTGFLYIRAVVSLIIKLYTSRLVLAGLGIENFGVYQIIGGIVTMFAFINTSMSQATMRFLSYALGKDDPNYINNIFSTSTILHFFIAIATTILVVVAGIYALENGVNIGSVSLSVAKAILCLTAFSLALNIVVVPFSSLVISKEDINYFAYVDIVNQVLIFLVALSLGLFASERLMIYSVLMFLVSLVNILIYIWLYIKLYKSIKFRWVYDKIIGKEMMSFSGWTALSAVAYVMQVNGIAVVVNLFFGPLLNAALGIATQVTNAVRTFSVNLGVSIGPQQVKSYAQKEFRRLNMLTLSGAKILLLLLIALAVPLILEIDFFLNLWLVEVPNHTATLVRLYLLFTIIAAMTSTYVTVIQATGKIKKYELIHNLVDLCPILVMFVLLKYYCYYYVPVLVLIVFTVITNQIRLYFMVKTVPEISLRKNIEDMYMRIPVAAILAILIPFFELQIMGNGALRVMMVTISFEVMLLITVRYIVLNEEEMKVIGDILKPYMNKVFKLFHK